MFTLENSRLHPDPSAAIRAALIQVAFIITLVLVKLIAVVLRVCVPSVILSTE